jgi:hypothetical protein
MRAVATIALTSGARRPLRGALDDIRKGHPIAASIRLRNAKRPSLVEVAFANKTHSRLMATSSRVNNALRADHAAVIKKPPQ